MFKPMLIIVAFISICVARWSAVFPLSRFLNFLYRARLEKYSGISSMNSNGSLSLNVPDEISHSYQMMIFWAGLRGAVGVALAMGFGGDAKWTLLATVLVVVVLTVILFGGTTASMLEILGIKTGCIDETADSDDEFDIEAPRFPLQANLTSQPNILGSRRFMKSQQKVAPFKDSTSNNSSAVNLLDNEANPNIDDGGDDEEELIGSDVDEYRSGSMSSPIYNNSTSNGDRGVLGAILSAEEHARWFTRFDEEVLKPVLLDTVPGIQPSANNSSSTNLSGSRRD